MLRNILKHLAKGLLFLGTGVLLYLVIALLGAWFKTGKKQESDKGSIPVFVRTNGFHTDWIVPVAHEEWNWLNHFDDSCQTQHQQAKYIAFGWGDKGFYLVSKTGKSQVLTALNAVFLPSTSVMHVGFLNQSPKASERTVQLCINKAQLKKLNQFILKSFKIDKKTKKFGFVTEGYHQRDYFFKAKGKYSLLFTCNNWTNRGLKKMNIRTGVWTPFSQGVFLQLR